jgi:hypothetical protein
VQFHLEADATMICDWLDSDTEDQISIEVEAMKLETAEKTQACLERGKKLLLNFFAGCRPELRVYNRTRRRQPHEWNCPGL